MRIIVDLTIILVLFIIFNFLAHLAPSLAFLFGWIGGVVAIIIVEMRGNSERSA